MDNEAKAVEYLARIAGGVDRLVAAIPQPASRTRRIVEAVVTTAAVLGILSAVDIIAKWIGG